MIKLGIIDYNDYIYNVSSNTRVLNTILEHNPELQAKTTSVVLADIIHQNAQLIGVLLAPQPKGSVLRSSPCFSPLPKGGRGKVPKGRGENAVGGCFAVERSFSYFFVGFFHVFV